MDSCSVILRLYRIKASRKNLAEELDIDPSTLWRFLSGKSKYRLKTMELAVEAGLDRLEAKFQAQRLSKTAKNQSHKTSS